MNRPGLRWVMLWPVVLTLSVGALALGIYVERSVHRDLLATTDSELARALNSAITRSLPPGGRPARPLPDAQGDADESDTRSGADVPLEVIISAEGAVRSQPSNDPDFDLERLNVVVGTSGLRTIDGDPRYRARSEVGPQGATVIVALPLANVDASMASLRRSLIIGGLVLVALQAAVVWLIAAAVARPVARMSDAAHRIASGELESDVGVPQGPRETATLAVDLAQMLERLRHTITVQEQAAAKANQARRDMERFMADASHEMGTPLTALRGYSDLYQNGMLDDEGLDRAMGRIGSESERLSRLVAELLDLSRDVEEKTEVDVAAVVSAVTHDLRAANPDRQISLNLGEGTFLVDGNAHRLHQAVLNLASNACQHTEDSTPIELEVRSDGANAIVAVVDHGAGVDLEHADDLFLPFTRGDESRSRRSHDGAGLGLALVHQIAEQHHGSVGVDATPGGGATFRLTIPSPSEAGQTD